jgi:general L-amino acid transport system permease protein
MTTLTPDSLPSTRPQQIGLGPRAWVKKHLFSDWANSLLTVVIVTIFGWGLFSLIKWAFTAAQWQVIPNNFGLFMTGTYPPELYVRIWTVLAIICALAGFSWGVLGRNLSTLFSRNVLIGIALVCALIILFPPTRPSSLKLLPIVALVAGMAAVGRQVGRKFPGVGKWVSLSWFLSYFVTLWLIGGGLGLTRVSTNDWGGLVLTLFTAVTGIALCFPLGLLLALGRRSALPVVRWLSTAYIELVRGVPLVAFLFMGQVMIPLFLPVGSRPDRVLRAIIALSLFSAAYLAENVRAGLQAVPRGQREAAMSLGLNTPLSLGLIILPQALKIAIPAIVGQFISLFQDTTLLAIVGLAELLGIGKSILANPTYLGRYAEVYLFLAVIYWFFCYAMSLGSRRLEEKLNTDNAHADGLRVQTLATQHPA